MKLLREFQDFNYDRALLEQSKKEGRFLMRGICQRADVINQNGRIYPREILEREVLNYQKLIKESRAYGEADHPERSQVEFSFVSHIVREMSMDRDGIVWATIEVFDSPTKGGIIREIANKGGTIGISSRGVGETENNGEAEIVKEWVATDRKSTRLNSSHSQISYAVFC